ncbi:hypothetical protein [Streptomyces sp. NPDC048252]
MGLLQNWGRQRMTRDAVAARERGDSTYVHTLATSVEEVRGRYISVIESEGWKLASLQENPATPRQRWTLTFQRASVEGGTADRLPPRA